MGLFGRLNNAAGSFVSSNDDLQVKSWTVNFPNPEDIGCDTTNTYEVTNWRDFCLKWSEHAKKVVKWEKLGPAYYRAALSNKLVIFYDAFEKSIFIRDSTNASVNTEKEWRREFARRLRRIMEYSGMDQIKLAEATGYSQSSICAYLGGNKLPSSYALYRLANALDCSIEFLCNFG